MAHVVVHRIFSLSVSLPVRGGLTDLPSEPYMVVSSGNAYPPRV